MHKYLLTIINIKELCEQQQQKKRNPQVSFKYSRILNT